MIPYSRQFSNESTPEQKCLRLLQFQRELIHKRFGGFSEIVRSGTKEKGSSRNYENIVKL